MANIPFGERLKRARIRHAITQADLGAKINVSQVTISNWENGNSAPRPSERELLKQILGEHWVASPKASNPAPVEIESGPSAVGSWLTQTRVGRGLSIPELATAAGLSAPALYNIENGRIANPRTETVRKLERALGINLSREAKEEASEEANIHGVGELVDFDPHDQEDLPSCAGIYVLYDISERPIYVGQGGNIKTRLRNHGEKFWYKAPIVSTGAYVKIEDEALRQKVELLLIRFLKSNAVINKQGVDR
jgi:transcriptional regulator with XRE-family HTH domain